MRSKIPNRILSLVCACALLIPFSAFALEGDRSSLRQAVEEAVTDLSPYTSESAALYTAALETARGVLAKEEAEQEEIDAALADLTAAAEGLIPAVSLIPGDVDQDRSITSTDARLMLQVSVAKLDRSVLPAPDAADLDGDQAVSSTDARMALQFSVGKIDLGHHLVTESGTPASCTEGGIADAVYCDECDLVVSVHKPTPPAGHKAVTDKAVSATCTEDGLTRGSHCSVCGLVLQERQTVPAVGHSDAPVCERCGRDNRQALVNQLKLLVAEPQRLYHETDDNFLYMSLMYLNDDGRLACCGYIERPSNGEIIALNVMLFEDADSLRFSYLCSIYLDNGETYNLNGVGVNTADVCLDGVRYPAITYTDVETQEDLEAMYGIAIYLMDMNMWALQNYLEEYFHSSVHVLGFENYEL